MTSEETARFTAAKERIIGKNRERNGIGTLSEKTVHAVLKNYYAPDETQHEIPVEGCVADIFNGKEIIEIQTRSFDRMRPKLERFLPLYPVTIVYPIPYSKHVFWIDEETGEISGGRKSPLKGSPYLAFKELYRIKAYLQDPNLTIRLTFLNMEEYKLLNGWSRDKKRGSSRYDRIPISIEQGSGIYLRTGLCPADPLRSAGAVYVRAARRKLSISERSRRVLCAISFMTSA